jgi:archaellum component FlaC
MTDEEDRVELIERRLAETVEERVRGRLFKVYGMVGGSILTILGLVGYDGLRRIQDIAIDAAKQEATAQVGPAVERARTVVEQARTAVEAATKQANAAEVTLQLAHERLDHVDDVLARGESRITGFATEIAEASTKYDSLNAEINKAESELVQTAAEIDNQQKRASDSFAGAGTLSDLARVVDTLTQQVSALNKQVKEITQIAKIVTTESGASQKELDKVMTEAVQAVPTTPATNTVFFQFAQLPRDQAKEIVMALRNRGYSVPGEDREDAAKDLQEVRYFFDDDLPAAGRLVTDVRATLEQLGFGEVPIKVKDLTSYKGQKPRAGVLELWLDLVPH